MSLSLEQVQAKVYAHLNKQQRATLERVGVGQTMLEIRLWIPEVKGVSDKDLRSMVVGYYLINRLRLARETDEQLEKAVEGGVEVPGKARVTRDGNSVKIGLSGLTVDLTRKFEKTTIKVGPAGASVGQTGVGGDKITLGVSWTGTLSLATSSGNLYLTSSLAKDRWEIKLSYPSDTPIWDTSKLGQIFGEGEKGLREVIRATPGILDLNDVRAKLDAVSPHLDKVLTALDAAQGIKKAKRGVNLGIKFGSPDPHPGEDKIPPGLQGAVGLTVIF